MSSDYRLSPAFGARLLGLLVVGLALLVLLVTGVVASLDLPGWLVLVAAGSGLATWLAAGLWLTRKVTVVHLGDLGYRVRLVRGAGVKSASWRDVEDAVTTTVRGVPCVVLRLRDGRTTTIPVPVLAGRGEDFLRDLQEHLQHGHGLRRL